jgi:hypothetical protein
MITKTLYIIQQPNGVITHTPLQPEKGIEYTTAYRLIADEGMILINDEQKTYCVDTDTLEGWEEIIDDTPQEPLMEVDKYERDENDQL